MRTENVMDVLRSLPDTEQAQLYTEQESMSHLDVVWNRRLKTAAGLCRFLGLVPVQIDLNPKLRREGTVALRQTLLHELAHALTGKLDGHGNVWKFWVRRLGADSTMRQHEYAALPAARRKLVGECMKCGMEIHRRRALPSKGTYRHSKCGGTIFKF